MSEYNEIADVANSTSVAEQQTSAGQQQASGLVKKSARKVGANSNIICKWGQCNLSFTDVSHLVAHLHDLHVGYKKGAHICQWQGCARSGVSQASRFSLTVHLRSHTNERPYDCPISECDKSFSRQDALGKHLLKTHSDYKWINDEWIWCPEHAGSVAKDPYAKLPHGALTPGSDSLDDAGRSSPGQSKKRKNQDVDTRASKAPKRKPGMTASDPSTLLSENTSDDDESLIEKDHADEEEELEAYRHSRTKSLHTNPTLSQDAILGDPTTGRAGDDTDQELIQDLKKYMPDSVISLPPIPIDYWEAQLDDDLISKNNMLAERVVYLESLFQGAVEEWKLQLLELQKLRASKDALLDHFLTLNKRPL